MKSEEAISRKKDYIKKFHAEAYDSFSVSIPKGRKADVYRYALSQHYTANGLVNELLRKALNMSEEEWKARE